MESNEYLPNISVVIPTYNRAKQVQNAINSVLQQSISVYEIIVVDDGSIDDTKNLLEKYDSKIIYLYQNNSGVAAARNFGIRTATGDWLAFLDSDDVWEPFKIQKQLDVLSKYDTEVCCTAYKDDLGNVLTNLTPNLPFGKSQHFTNAFNLVFKFNEHPFVQSMLIKKSLIMKLGFFDETLRTAEDTKLFYRIAFETGISYINEPLFILNRTRDIPGLTDNKEINAALSLYDCSCRVQSEAYWMLISRDTELAKIVRANMGYFMSRLAEIHLVLGNYKLSKRYAKEGLKYFANIKVAVRCLILLLAPWLVQKAFKQKWISGSFKS